MSLFITFEGIEGVGKSTVLKYVREYLDSLGVDFIMTREPGGTVLAEEIRSLLLAHRDETVTKETELLLLFAARSQHIENIILPAIKNNKYVLCDRFTDASFAYQGGGRGISFDKIESLKQLVQKDLTPDLTFILDLDVKKALERAKNRGDFDRIELEEISFFQRARDTYIKRAKQNPEKYRIIDADQDIEKVKKDVIEIISKFTK